MMRLEHLIVGVALVAAACSGEPVEDATWEVDRIEAEGALMSVWGSGPQDVWAAGGRAGQGLMLHNDGSGWSQVETGADELLWWVYGFSAKDVYAVGEGGLIIHYDGVSWQRIESGTKSTLFGVWGDSGGDVYIVGGDTRGGNGSAVVLRGNAEAFINIGSEIPREIVPDALFKIYGSPEGLVAVGTGGTVLRYDGADWTQETTPTKKSLFSLWGREDNDVYAVGGAGHGEVLHFDGNEWTKINDDGLDRGLSGVFTAPDQPLIAVGDGSFVLEIMPDGTMLEPQMPVLEEAPALHGVWGDGNGTTYAVGGDLYSFSGPTKGVIFKRQ